MTMGEEKHWQEGIKTHEKTIYVHLGCPSNTGTAIGFGSLEPVKELGFEKILVRG